MEKPYVKMNNKGSTLLTVIIIMVLVGILGSMMLSVTMTNLQMKMVERKAKENFYTCEIAMDEIRTGLQELTAEKIREVYETDILKNISDYLNMAEDDLNLNIKNKVFLLLIKHIGDTGTLNDTQLLSGSSVEEKNLNIFNDYLTVFSAGSKIVRSLSIGNLNISAGDSMTVTDIDVRLTKEDFESRITTDIVINLPDFTFDEGLQNIVYRMEQPYKDYALVADGKIISDHTLGDGATGENIINGSIYAGDGGITIGSQLTQYHEVTIHGGNIVTRGNITVKDTGRLTVRGSTRIDPDTGLPVDVPAVIWADNLITETTEMPDPSFTIPTVMDIEGICLIKDDLTLEGNYSDVRLSGGYVGYTGTHSSLGSSIIVNGAGSTLKLFELDSLILAGRAHVSVTDEAGVSGKVTDILTGESVAIKSNQQAYLIPGKFIKDIKHNPVTSWDIGTYAIPQVDFTGLDPAVDMDYTAYVDVDHPFKIASKQTVEGDASTILYYYYLGFESGKQADTYLQEYLSRDSYSLDQMYPFYISDVILPDPAVSEIICAGNMMSYDADAAGIPKVGIHPGLSNGYPTDPAAANPDVELDNYISGLALNNPAYLNAGLQPVDTVGLLNGLYSNMTHLLSTESTRVYRSTDQVVETTVIPTAANYIRDWFATDPAVDYRGGFTSFDTEISGSKIIVVNGDAVINSNLNGLLIVSGDVSISDGVNINGMIVAIDSDPLDGIRKGNISVGDFVNVNGRLAAMGDIILGADDTFTAAYESLDDIFLNRGEVLQNIFRNAKMSVNFIITEPADSLVDLSSMLTFENWRKN